MKTQSVRVYVLVWSYIIASSLVHIPSYATGSAESNYLASGNEDAILPTSSTTELPAALDIDSWSFAIPITINHAVIGGFDSVYEHLIGSTDGQPSGHWTAAPVKSDVSLDYSFHDISINPSEILIDLEERP